MSPTPRKYHVLYPDDMWLTEDDIERRFHDAVAANELCTDYLDARTPDDMAAALHEAGFIHLMIGQSAVGICPDLLAALKELIEASSEALYSTPQHAEWYKKAVAQARAAIAKVEGKS